MTIIGKGIQTDVDVVIELEIVAALLTGDHMEAVGRDVELVEGMDDSIAGSTWRDEEHQTRFREGAENPCPELQDMIIDFAEIVQAAECDISVAERWKVVDRVIGGEWVVTPESFGKPDGGFGVA